MARLGLLLEAFLLLLPLLAAEAKEKPSYYEVLEISKDANPKAIKQAYRKLALKWHPDKNPDNREEAEIRFREVAQAYEVLSDPDKRRHYDKHGTDPGQGGGGGGDPFNGFGGFGGFRDPKDLFKDMFGDNDPFKDFSKFFDMDMEEETTGGSAEDALASLEEALSTFYKSVGQPEKGSLQKVREVILPKWKGKEDKLFRVLQGKYKDPQYSTALDKLGVAFEGFRNAKKKDGSFSFGMGGDGFPDMGSMFSGGFFGGGAGFGGGGGGSSSMSSFSFSSSTMGGGKTVRSETKIVDGKRVTKIIESDGENTRATMEREENGRVKRQTGVKRNERLSDGDRNDEM